MTIPGYRPLTPNDQKPAILTMALGASWFTVIAASYHEASKTPGDAHDPWPAILWSFMPFFGGFLWLVLDSWHHGRAWWKLLFWSSGSSASGAAQLFGITGLVPVAIGMWGWTAAMVVIVFGTDFTEERDEFEADREAPLAGNNVGTPWKPTENDRPRNTHEEA